MAGEVDGDERPVRGPARPCPRCGRSGPRRGGARSPARSTPTPGRSADGHRRGRPTGGARRGPPPAGGRTPPRSRRTSRTRRTGRARAWQADPRRSSTAHIGSRYGPVDEDRRRPPTTADRTRPHGPPRLRAHRRGPRLLPHQCLRSRPGAEHGDRTPPLTGPYTEDDAFHEVLTLYAWWAAMTERIELVPGVLVLPQRQTALVAKQVAEIDILSGGRMRLCVGSGWNHVEYESLGVDFRRRGTRLEEQVALMRRLWTERVVDFTGTFHRVDRAGSAPAPEPADPDLVRWLRRRRARPGGTVGDGFIFSRASSGATLRMDQVRARAEEAGRDPAQLRLRVDPAGGGVRVELDGGRVEGGRWHPRRRGARGSGRRRDRRTPPRPRRAGDPLG